MGNEGKKIIIHNGRTKTEKQEHSKQNEPQSNKYKNTTHPIHTD